MKQNKGSLRRQLFAGIILFGVLLCVGTSLLGYREFTVVLERQYNDTAYRVAETAESYLNPDRFEEYLSTRKTDREYEEIEQRLDDLTDKMGATFIYVASVDRTDYRVLTYIYDSVDPDSGFDRYELGYTAVGVDEKYVGNVKRMMENGERATEYLYSYSQESGAHTTAGLPVRDSDGEIVAILGVEMPMTELDNARQTYVLHVVAVSAVMISLFLLVGSLLLSRGVIQPLILITNEAERFAASGVQRADTMEKVQSRNEIGVLASSVGQMELDIEKYVRDLTAVTAERERIGAELSVAFRIQSDILPAVFPAFPDRKDFDIYASMAPAREVGGDFYDFFLIDESRLGLVIADVSGKGVPAALFMMIARTLIRNHVQSGEEPADALTAVNEQLCENNKENMFVTAWLGVLDLSSGQLKFANAGHNPPLFKHGDGEYEYMRVRAGLVLAGMEGIRYRQSSVQLSRGDRIFLYTDGVTEAESQNHIFYGEERLCDVLRGLTESAPEETVAAVDADVRRFAEGAEQVDDITMMCLEYTGNGSELICTVPAEREQLYRVLEFTEAQTKEAGASRKETDRLLLAVEEIFVNIADYAYADGRGDVTVKVRRTDNAQMEITFSDSGVPYDPLEKPDPDTHLAAEKRQEGGLGILLAKNMMDEMEYERRDGRNILTMKKRFMAAKE